MSDVIYDAAVKASHKFANITDDKEAALDPATINTFVELIMQLIEMFKNCKKPADVPVAAKNPKGMERLAVRLRVRREVGRREFRRNGDQIVDALFETAAETSVDEMKRLYDAV